MVRSARPLLWALVAAPLAGGALGGCEGPKVPTAAELKIRQQHTATGPQYSRLEIHSQPDPPRAGEISIWNFKVYEPKDKADHLRTEIKFYVPLPQGSDEPNTTDVLMNAWLISDDLSVFQSTKPSYKQYGSFVAGWTIAKPGPYALWVEYEPKPEFEDKPDAYQPGLRREMARWHFTAAPSNNASYQAPPALLPPKPMRQGNGETFAAHREEAPSRSAPGESGQSAPTVTLQRTAFRRGVGGRLDWKPNAPGQLHALNVVALSPDGKILRHWVASSALATFEQIGRWHLWFEFKIGDEKFIAPYVLQVAP